MSVAFDVSQFVTFSEASDEQQKNTPVMSVTFDVSHSERSSEVSEEQWANILLIVVVLAVSKWERSASSRLRRLANRAEQLAEAFTPGSTTIVLMLGRISLVCHGIASEFDEVSGSCPSAASSAGRIVRHPWSSTIHSQLPHVCQSVGITETDTVTGMLRTVS